MEDAYLRINWEKIGVWNVANISATYSDIIAYIFLWNDYNTPCPNDKDPPEKNQIPNFQVSALRTHGIYVGQRNLSIDPGTVGFLKRCTLSNDRLVG